MLCHLVHHPYRHTPFLLKLWWILHIIWKSPSKLIQDVCLGSLEITYFTLATGEIQKPNMLIFCPLSIHVMSRWWILRQNPLPYISQYYKTYIHPRLATRKPQVVEVLVNVNINKFMYYEKNTHHDIGFLGGFGFRNLCFLVV